MKVGSGVGLGRHAWEIGFSATERLDTDGGDGGVEGAFYAAGAVNSYVSLGQPIEGTTREGVRGKEEVTYNANTPSAPFSGSTVYLAVDAFSVTVNWPGKPHSSVLAHCRA